MTEHAEYEAACVAARRAWDALGVTASLTDACNDSLAAVFAASEYVRQQCQRRPQLLVSLDSGGELHHRWEADAFRAAIREQLADGRNTGLAEQSRRLRQVRHREMTRIAWRDLAAWADVEETLSELSLLAEMLIEVATDWAHGHVETRHGVLRSGQGDPQSLVVVAMGKLGGRELNFSSDVDLVLLYPRSGSSDGAREIDAERYFARVGQRLIQLLDTPTDDGFVFRVDSRLRPFGSSGPLAMSFAAFEAYLQRHGREWERYAYLKSRPLTGTVASRLEFVELVRPFVYRRYLDFGVLESLREMKALIAADVQRRDRRDDIKLGPGGIREIEFIVQTYQLLRGGTTPTLRNPHLLSVLPAIGRRNWLSEVAVRKLAEAYRFLRRTENRLQQWRDQQVHQLPADSRARYQLARNMGFENWSDYAARLQRHRAVVTRYFNATVADESGQQADQLAALWRRGFDGDAANELLKSLGYKHPRRLQQLLCALHGSAQYQSLDRRGRERLDILVPRIVRMAVQRPDGDKVARRLLRIVESVGRRSAYFALLNENPPVLERLNDLAASSPWVARRVAERPILLDELIDPRLFEQPPARDDFVAELQHRFAGIAQDDLERQMDALREFQQASVFRVAVADLAGVLPLMKVSDRLTEIAELVLDKVIELADHDISRRYGEPRCGEPGELRRPGFAVIGYGKLGGLELGYASDLDIVLIHDSAGTVNQTDGTPPLDNSRYFARLGQRMLHMLSTATMSGVLYEVDTRLRPSGKAGPLVSSLEAFGRYQRSSAWTWEHQALLRARGVAGSAGVIAAFEALRRDVLTERQDADELRRRVTEMRARMQRELPGGGAGEFDIKRDTGGLTDIEFIVQYLVLAHASKHPQLVRYSDNIRQLELLAEAGLMAGTDAAELADIYRRYRQRLHRLALADEPGIVTDAEFVDERAAVRAYWEIVLAE